MPLRLFLGAAIGFGAGYVLGSKAGRERYQQIRQRASEVWEDPRLRKLAHDAEDALREAAPAVQARVADLAKAAKDRVTGTSGSGDTDESGGAGAGNGESGSAGAGAGSTGSATGTPRASSSPPEASGAASPGGQGGEKRPGDETKPSPDV